MFQSLFFRARYFAAVFFGLRGPPPEVHPLPPIVRSATFGARAEVAASRVLSVTLTAQRAALSVALQAVRD
jgi:hypothetical protein